jgi:hypothetical protein
MPRTARGRILAVALVLTGLALLCPVYAQQPVNPELGVYPEPDDFIASPEPFVGDAVTTDGFVQQVSPLVIEVETPHGASDVTITSSELRPEVGDKVRVFGTLTDPRTIRSHHAFVVPQGGLWYTWGVSFLAGLWVLGRLIRHWTVDVARLRFQRRDDSLSLRALLAAWRSRGGDRGA